MALPAARPGVAGAGAAALVVGDGMLEVGLPGLPGAGREGALAVADLDEMAQPVAGLVTGGLVPVVTGVRGDLAQRHDEPPAAGQGQGPGAEAARRPELLERPRLAGCPLPAR